ncbi:hypothetical protein Tco_0317507 [Tanacetum coccineum]
MTNRINLHINQDDSLLGTLKFVSKTEDYQKYRALIPEQMINQAIKDSKAYKIYLDFATGKEAPKKSRKFKKIASPLKEQTLVLEDEPAKKPKQAKHPELAKKSAPTKEDVSSKKPSRKKSVGVVIKDTLGVSVSKKKAPTNVDRGKGMDLLFDVALLEVAQLKKVLKKSKQDTHMLHANGSDDGVGSQPKVPDELQYKTTGTNEGTSTIPRVLDVPKDQSESENESWGEKEETQDDEFVHTLDVYVPTNDEPNDESKDVDEEEYERINKELYGDVNVSLTDVELDDKDKGDKEMTNADIEDVEHENVIQESAGNQVKDDAQATQNTEGQIPSSSISSDYAAKYLNFDNIPLVDTEVVSMLDINVQHEVPCTSPLLTIPVSIILEHTVVNPPEILITALSTTISSLLLQDFDHSIALLSVPSNLKSQIIKEYLGTSLDDALYKVLKKHDADIIKEHYVPAEIVERLRDREDKDKDEDPLIGSDQGLKRRNTSKDAKPLKGPKLKESKSSSSKDTKSQPKSSGNTDDQPNVKATPKHDWFKEPERPPTHDSDWNVGKFIDHLIQNHLVGPTFNLLKGTCRSHVELEYNIEECYKVVTNRLDWNNPKGKEYPFDLSKPLPLIMDRGPQVVPVDYFINNDLKYMKGGSSSKKYTTSTIKTKATTYDIPGTEDMVPSLWSPVKTYCHSLANGRPTTGPETFRLMRTDELYKFSDGTLTSVRSVLHDIASNLRMDYLPKRRWSKLDRKRKHYYHFRQQLRLRQQLKLKQHSDLQSTDGLSSFDTSTSEENVNSSTNIISSKGLSKSLLNWYEDLSDEYKEILWFSKSRGKVQPSGSKAKALGSKAKTYGSKAKAYGSKAKASGSKAKAFGSKTRASPKTLIVKSPIHRVMTGIEEKKEKRKMGGGS